MQKINRQSTNKQTENSELPDSRYLETVFNNRNIKALTQCLDDQASSYWVQHVNKNAYKGSWDVIPLRCVAQHVNSHPILQSFTHHSTSQNNTSQSEAWVDLPLMNYFPYIQKMLTKIYCPIKSVRFMRLSSGAKILPHRDKGVSLMYGEARLHIPIVTAAQVDFYVSKNKIVMNTGELWYIDANKEHSVENKSQSDRVHLVIDCISNKWLQQRVLKT